MKKSKFTDSQIMSILKQNESGVKVTDLCREHGISLDSKYHYFLNSVSFINFNMYHIDKKNIYKEYHYLLDSVIEKNFDKFFSLVNGQQYDY